MSDNKKFTISQAAIDEVAALSQTSVKYVIMCRDGEYEVGRWDWYEDPERYGGKVVSSTSYVEGFWDKWVYILNHVEDSLARSYLLEMLKDA